MEDIRRLAVALSLRHRRGQHRWKLALAHTRLSWDGVTPVGRLQSLPRIHDAESRCKATDHAAGAVRFTRHLVDTLDEDVIRWGRLGELQDDLVRPGAHVVGQGFVSGGALLVTLDQNTLIKLMPELERDGCDVDVTDDVPCGKRVVQLLSRVERSEELGLCDGQR